VRPGGGSPTSHRTRGSPATCNRDPISSAQGLIQGGGGEAREFSLSPPWSYLPALSWRNASQGGDLSTSPRPFEPPISVPGHPRPASLRARTSVPGAARSTARILTVTRWGGELVGEASGWRGSFPGASPSFLPPGEQRVPLRGICIRVLSIPAQILESGGSHAWQPTGSPTLHTPVRPRGVTCVRTREDHPAYHRPPLEL